MRTPPHILLVNPWIHDFAAYDFWAKPLGLLTLAALLRADGYAVSYLDCLDRFDPRGPTTDPAARCGRGPYLKTAIPKPESLSDVARTFSRYGIPPAWFRSDLKALDRPDLVLVTSLMTYWYPGVQEAVGLVRKAWPRIPILLGGIYATLCPQHAKKVCGADQVVTGSDVNTILSTVARWTGFSPNRCFDAHDPDTYPHPALDLQTHVAYIPLLTATGCPYACAYCASRYLHPIQHRRTPESVVAEIERGYTDFGVRDFVFYDDALLVDAENHALPILEAVVRANHPLRFHTPNALHVREINAQTADIMARAGFETIRLGLETTAFETRGALDGKLTAQEFENAVGHLKSAGFNQKQIGAYLLAGLPGQSLDSLEASFEVVHRAGITPIPAYYSPIPHTALWPRAVTTSRYDLAADPIFTNNAIWPCQRQPFQWEALTRIKALASGGR